MRRIHRVACSWLVVATIACGGGDKKHEPTLDERILNVNAVGTRVDGTIYTVGRFEVLVLPLAADGSALLDPAFSARARVIGPAGLDARVVGTSCAPDVTRKQLAAGVAVDVSGSMGTMNDPPDATGPAPMRKAAVGAIVGAMLPQDVALVTDFSAELLPRATPLRDLVCAHSNPAATAQECAPQATGFISDRALLAAATTILTDYNGSPIYEACVQMVSLLETQAGARRALLLLSDGLPNEEAARTACLSGARGANASIFTIGFGAAAEGSEYPCSSYLTCPTGWACRSGLCRYNHGAVLAMRELAQATGGAYAPATSPERLLQMLERLAYTAGSCTIVVELTGAQQLAPGTPVEIEIDVGSSGARVTFQFLAPPP